MREFENEALPFVTQAQFKQLLDEHRQLAGTFDRYLKAQREFYDNFIRKEAWADGKQS